MVFAARVPVVDNASMISPTVAVQHVQRGEKRCGAVALVVVRERSAPAFLQGQPRPGPVQRLYPALLVNAENDSLVGRIQVESDDIRHFLKDLRVPRKLEGPVQVRFQVVKLPEAVDRVLAYDTGS